MITATLDQKAYAAYLKRLDKNHGKPLLVRAEKTINSGAKLLIPPVRAAAPVGPGKRLAGGFTRGGNLRRKVGVKLVRKQGGEDIRPTWVGTKAWYGRLVATGTSAHSLAPRGGKSTYAVFDIDVVRPLAGMTHPGSRAAPFVPDAVAGSMSQVVAIVKRDVFDIR